ncbi:MAG: efflux RND transporter periplasmic adaptor subunit, partial [Lachnospiraceae bacterium]|nr:efflux RND transporter periplasmic adaptor subunit [Lachnospiraceae bacterium]
MFSFKKLAALSIAAVLAIGTAGCGAVTEKAAVVQSVAMLAGLTDVMQAQNFAGVVSVGKEESIKKDASRKVAKVHVKVDDVVEAGAVLFTYDSEQAQNSLDKARLELEELNNTLSSKEKEKAQLESDKTKAAQREQLDYTLKIQETDTDIREAQYNIGLKEKEIKTLEAATTDLDVYAPFAGKIVAAGEADALTTTDNTDADAANYASTEDSDDSAFIKMMEIDNYKIKGTVNEQNRSAISVGQTMKIIARTGDAQTWTGVVSSVDFTSAMKSNTNDYSDTQTDEMTSTSKYAFYVDIDALDGLIVGQHVYMQVDDGTGEEEGSIKLSSGFFMDADTSPWVWAEGKDQKLEKRMITLGNYNADDDTYYVTSGLTEDDYIAFPNDDYKEGLPCTENDETAFAGEDETLDDEEYADGEEYTD